VPQRFGELVGRGPQREDEPLPRVDRVVPHPLRADAPARRDPAHVLDEIAGRERVRDPGRVTEPIDGGAARQREEFADAPDAEQRELRDHLWVERQHVEREAVQERALATRRDLAHLPGGRA